MSQSSARSHPQLILLSRGDCALCDKAEAMLRELKIATVDLGGGRTSFIKADISRQEFLNQRYSWSIPVVYRSQLFFDQSQPWLDDHSLSMLSKEILEKAGGPGRAQDILIADELCWPFPPSRLRSFSV